MSSKKNKLIIFFIVVMVVGAVAVFKLQKGPQNNVSSVPKIENQDKTKAVENSNDAVKQDLIKDDTSDPAVSKDDVENEKFNPALDETTPDPNADNPKDVIEDPGAGK